MKTSLYKVVIDFSLVGPSVGGISTRDASVTMVEKVAEIGDESNSPLVTMLTNSVLTPTVSVLLAICVLKRMIEFEKAVVCLGRDGFSEESMAILVWLYICLHSCFEFLCSLSSNRKRFFLCQS